jgi:hypothetical protein
MQETALNKDEQALSSLKGQCICARPDKDLHNFQGSIII